MKNIRSRSFLMFMSVLIISFIIAGCSNDSSKANGDGNSASDGEVIEIRFAHVLAQDSTIHRSVEHFKEVIEEESDGEFEVTIYPDAQLGGDGEATESVQSGKIEMARPPTGTLSNFSSTMKIFDYPFLFDDLETVYSTLDGPIGDQILEDLEEHNFIGLGYGEDGFRHLTNSVQPISTPDDVKGLTIRTFEAPMHIDFWTEMGASPTTLDFDELYSALDTGVADGHESPYQTIRSSKLYEVNEFITESGVTYGPEPFIINKDFFEGLAEDQQQLIRDSVQSAVEWQREENAESEDDIIQEIIDEGVEITELTDKESDEWEKASIPFYEKYKDEVDKNLLIEILEKSDKDEIIDAIK